MGLKWLVTAAFGSSEPFCLESGRVVSAPSLHRESTDSLIYRWLFTVLSSGLCPKVVYPILPQNPGINLMLFLEQTKWTPLMIASHNGHVDIVNILLQHGGSVHLHDMVRLYRNNCDIFHVRTECYSNCIQVTIAVMRVSN